MALRCSLASSCGKGLHFSEQTRTGELESRADSIYTGPSPLANSFLKNLLWLPGKCESLPQLLASEHLRSNSDAVGLTTLTAAKSQGCFKTPME